MKKFLIAALVATSGSAHAADLVYNNAPAVPEAPASAHVFSWEGAYVGAQIGYAHGKDSYAPATGASSIFKDSGVGYGAFAGYNFMFDHGLVTGVELGLGTSDLNARSGGNGFKSTLNYDVSSRIGYAFNKALIYGSVGYGVQNFDVTYPNTAKKGKSDGIVYGVGLNYALSDHMFTRLNYQYRDFRSNVVNTLTKKKLGAVDFDQHTFGVGIGYKF